MLCDYDKLEKHIEQWLLENKDRKQKSILNLSGLQIEKYENIPSTVESILCNGNKVLNNILIQYKFHRHTILFNSF